MLDYQLTMLTRAISHERIHGRFAHRTEYPTLFFYRGVLRDRRRRLVALLAKPVNSILGQRYQNRHRSLEGTT